MTVSIPIVYELWDTETGNLIGDYTAETAALLDVRDGVRHDGAEPWAAVALARVAPDGKRVTLAQGTELVARAEAALSRQVMIGDARFDAAAVVRAAAAAQLSDTLADFDLDKAVWSVRAALDALHKDPDAGQRAAMSAQIAFAALLWASGSTLVLDITNDMVMFRTPNQLVAGLLAARISYSSYVVRMRMVEDRYLVELSVPDAEELQRLAS